MLETYDGCYTSQLEILEVVHLTLVFFFKFGGFQIRAPSENLATSAPFLLDFVVHLHRKGVNGMAGKNPSELHLKQDVE